MYIFVHQDQGVPKKEERCTSINIIRLGTAVICYPFYFTLFLLLLSVPPCPQACLGLKSYCSDGTRTKLRFCLHILAHPDSRREVSRKSLFVIVEPHSNIQKKSLEEKVVNIQICLFSSQDEKVVSNSIYKKHTTRYLTATIHSRLKRRGELPSGGARADVHEVDRCVKS